MACGPKNSPGFWLPTGEAAPAPTPEDPWARGSGAPAVKRNPHKDTNPLAQQERWGFQKALHEYEWSGDHQGHQTGSWVGHRYIPHGPNDGATSKGVPSKEMLLALARGETTVDGLKKKLEKDEPAPAAKPAVQAGPAAPVIIAATSEEVISCPTFDIAQVRYPEIIKLALKSGPPENAFRKHWSPDAEYHESLKGFIAKAALVVREATGGGVAPAPAAAAAAAKPAEKPVPAREKSRERRGNRRDARSTSSSKSRKKKKRDRRDRDRDRDRDRNRDRDRR